MAYTAVPTVATGDLWTASNHNTYIRDNFAAGVPDIFTTKGDLAAASAANAASRLAVGANGQTLVADSAQALGLKWMGPIAAHYVKLADQVVPNNTRLIIDFGTKTFDTYNAVTVGENWHFTAPVDGYYNISAIVTLEISAEWVAGEVAEIEVLVNGVLQRFLDRRTFYGPSDNSSLIGSCVLYLLSGQQLDLRLLQFSGGSVTIMGAIEASYISIFMVR